MNSSSVNITDFLKIQSLQIIHSYFLPQLLYMFFCPLNLVCCSVSFLILNKNSKTLFYGRTFLLLRVFFLNDLICSAYIWAYQSWHIANNFSAHDEAMPRSHCFRIVGPQLFFIFNNILLSLMIGIDRWLSIYSISRQDSQVADQRLTSLRTICMLSVPFVTSGLVYTSCALDNGDADKLVLYCSARVCTGPRTTRFMWSSQLALNTITVLAYLGMLTANYHQKKISSLSTNNNLNAIKLKMNHKVNRVLAFMTFGNFAVGPLQSGLSVLFVEWLPDMLLSVGLYLGWLTFVIGTMYMGSLIFVEQFRDELLKMIWKGQANVDRTLSIVTTAAHGSTVARH